LSTFSRAQSRGSDRFITGRTRARRDQLPLPERNVAENIHV
jgi:hypothetical protein